MTKTLRIVSVAAGIVCFVSMIIMCCVYFEKIFQFFDRIKRRITRTTIYGNIED